MMTQIGFRLLFLVIFALIRFLCLINRNKCSYFNILLLNYSFWHANWQVNAIIVSRGQNGVFFLDLLKTLISGLQFYHSITATIACNMDLTKYPMDRQVCTLQLESCEYLAPNHPSFVPVNINGHHFHHPHPHSHHPCSEYLTGRTVTSLPNDETSSIDKIICSRVCSGGYNLQDVVFYWTRGNDSVKGLDTLRLAQYSVESYYTTVSEAVYETGRYPRIPCTCGTAA